MTEYVPRAVWYASDTQRVANEAPMWWAIRRKRDSKGQSYLGPAGRTLDQINKDLERLLRDRFIHLVNLDEPDQLRRVELAIHEGLVFPTQVENELFNSSFEILTSHDRLPDYWQSDGDGTVEIGSGLLGARSIKLTTSSLQTAGIYQEVPVGIRAGMPWCFYVWYQSAATGLTAPATGFGLEVIGTRNDATTETLRTAFVPDTQGASKICVVLGSFSQDVVKFKVRAVVTNTAGFPITTPVYVDIAMAAPGNAIKRWYPNVFDTYPWLNYYDGLAPVVVEFGRRAQYVERVPDFWDKAYPTRSSAAELISSGGTPDPAPSAGADGFTVYAQAGEHAEVDVWKAEWPVTFQLGLDGANPKIRGIGLTSPDIFGPFDLAFRNWRNYFEDGISWTPETMTWFHERLHVVLKKQDHLGNTKRYLAIVDQRFSRPFLSYMEVVTMIEITGISTGVGLTRAEYRYSDQQHIYLGDGEYEWVVQLHYDYFIVDKARKRLYMREEYDQVVPQLTVPAMSESVSLRPRQ